MCGIVGVLADSPDEHEMRVKRMTKCLRHRGPDDAGYAVCAARDHDPRTWLFGHRRLSIIDLSPAAHQPMIDARTGNAIIFNGEIYNFIELRGLLESKGYHFISRTDTEVVLAAYSHWGTSVVDHLRGMFAFAIFDAAAGKVLLGRDRLGEKPLYYCLRPAVTGIRFAFASELRALLAGEIVSPTIARSGLQTYLTNGFVVGPATLIEGIRLLDPGTTLIVDRDGHGRFHRFWEIPLNDPGRPSDRESVRTLGETLSESVRRQLVSDVPLGAFLSGGIDSSVVVGLAQKHLDHPLRTFTVVFEEQAYSEARYAQAVSDVFGTDHREITLTRTDFERGVPDIIESLDQPSFDGANTYFVSRAARDLGLTVALAGTGGDELFGGYASFAQLRKVHLLRQLTSIVPTRALRSIRRLALWFDGIRNRGFPNQAAIGKAISLLNGRGDLVHIYQTLYRIFLEETVAALLEDYDASGTPDGLDGELSEYLSGRTAGRTDSPALSLMELHNYLGNRLLRDTDAMSMAVSLEVRLPLIDYQLLEAVARLDDHTRFEPLGRKRCLLKAASLALPASVVGRSKSGFVLPMDVWLRDTLRKETAGILLDPRLCRRAGLRPESVATLWRQFMRGDSGLYWSRIWALYVLLRWCARQDAAVSS